MLVVDKATEELSISNRVAANNKIPLGHDGLSLYVFQLAGAIIKRCLWGTVCYLEGLGIVFCSSETPLPKHIK